MKTFRDHTDKRRDHMTWKKGDIEILPDEDDRSSHMSWKAGDVEVLPEKPIKDSLAEDSSSYEPHTVETAHLRKTTLGPNQQQVEPHRDYFDKHHHDMGSDVRSGVSRYKEDSGPINHPLRTSKRSQGGIILNMGSTGDPYGADLHDKRIRRIQVLERATSLPSPSDFTVYKGVQPNAGFHKLKPGQRFVDHGFTGTSFDPKIGYSFGGRYHQDHDIYPGEYPPELAGHKIIARIHVPKGTHGHYLDVNGGVHSHENEYLLHRGTQFRVLGHSSREDNNLYPAHIVDLSVEGQHPKRIINPHESASFQRMMPRHHDVLTKHGFSQIEPGFYAHQDHNKGTVALTAPYKENPGEWSHQPGKGNPRYGTTHISLEKSLQS